MRAMLAVLVLALLSIMSKQYPAGIDFTLRNSPTKNKFLLETMGGGVALFDYNNDGRLDVFFVNGGKLDPAAVNSGDFGRGDPAFWNHLYRQNENGSFTDVTVSARLSQPAGGYGMGVATGDYNNDGYVDLYVTNYGVNVLYRNNGDGTFSDVSAFAGVQAGGWSVSAGFLDYDNDGRLDLFAGRYLDYDLKKNVACGSPFHTYCRPDYYRGMPSILYHNEGNGRFKDVSASAGIGSVIGKAMGVSFEDYDDDGYADIFVSNDGMEQFLFHNNRNGTFTEQGLEAGVALSDDGKPYSGMGTAFADYDNDGRPDLLITNLALEKWALYHNDGSGFFSYAGLTTGLAALTVQNSGWGVGLYDFDNDGRKDILAARSHVLDNVERVNSALAYRETPGLYRNQGDKFVKQSLPGLAKVAGRGCAFGDLNNDGAWDAIVSVLGAEPVTIYGHPNQNHWLTIKLVGTRSNRDGQGARIRLGQQRGYCSSAGSYLSASSMRVHFGLGREGETPLEILWPSGKRQTIDRPGIDRTLTVKEPE